MHTGAMDPLQLPQWVGQLSTIVVDRKDSIASLLAAAEPDLRAPDFDLLVGTYLRQRPALVGLWETYGADQRGWPNPYLDGSEVGFFDGARRNIRHHDDRAEACADFIHRLAAWVLERDVSSA
jgi:hypothetical protein